LHILNTDSYIIASRDAKIWHILDYIKKNAIINYIKNQVPAKNPAPGFLASYIVLYL